MKRIMFILAILTIAALSVSWGGEPVFNIGGPDSHYTITNGTISVSSSAVTTVAAVDRFREIYIGDLDSTVTTYYRVDGSTVNIPTVGWWILPGESKRIETNGTIKLQLATDAATATLRYVEFRK
jgi:hypothetical protein